MLRYNMNFVASKIYLESQNNLAATSITPWTEPQPVFYLNYRLLIGSSISSEPVLTQTYKISRIVTLFFLWVCFVSWSVWFNILAGQIRWLWFSQLIYKCIDCANLYMDSSFSPHSLTTHKKVFITLKQGSAQAMFAFFCIKTMTWLLIFELNSVVTIWSKAAFRLKILKSPKDLATDHISIILYV